MFTIMLPQETHKGCQRVYTVYIYIYDELYMTMIHAISSHLVLLTSITMLTFPLNMLYITRRSRENFMMYFRRFTLFIIHLPVILVCLGG